MNKYVLVEWPEIQDYMDHPRYNECYIVTPIIGENYISTYVVPEDLYEEIQYKKAPKEIEFEGELYDMVWFHIEKGDKILVETETGLESLTAATSYKPPFYGYILFEEKTYLPGISCEILGVKHEKISS